MINITDKTDCCGCEACIQVCPKHCISMVQDTEGFLYPQVNLQECITCELCIKSCPVINPYNSRQPEQLYAAINKNDDIRLKSSSGGVFFILAEQTIRSGGIVFGARFDETWQVIIDSAEDMDQVERFMGSKYLQAKVSNSYIRCREFLELGKRVLFSGTPCQISGLLHFLHKPYKNLLTVDFICHGVPNPEVWRRYLTETISDNLKEIQTIQFRNKKHSWNKYSLYIKYTKNQDTIEEFSPAYKNLYMQAFLSNITLRPSCYRCPTRIGSSHSDITIADFWNIQQIDPTMYDDMGTSLIIIHNKKGHSAIPFEQMKFKQEPIESLQHNPSYYTSPSIPNRRHKFYIELKYTNNVDKLFKRVLRPTPRQLISGFIHFPIRIIKQILKKAVLHTS